MVPDFQLEVPSPTGGRVSRLAELKVIICCPTRYLPGATVKAVEKRAFLLQGEYKKARNADSQFVGTAAGQMGPVENKLLQCGDLQGLVVGAFGEGSEDLHSLVLVIAALCWPVGTSTI